MNILLPASKRLFRDKVYLTIGVFDGVHLGHRKIIRSLVGSARRHKVKAVILTFTPHPAAVVRPYKAPPLLLSVCHRLRLLSDTGVDRIFLARFDRAIADLTAREFMDQVVRGVFNAKALFVGENFVLGKAGKGTAGRLCELGREFGVTVTIIKNKNVDGSPVSSTRIRALVMRGKFRAASRLLGRPYSILGTVVHGDKYGRILGFPTANLDLHHEAEPPSGVYPVLARLGRRCCRGVMNIGFRPTIDPALRQRRIEVHLFNFHRKIYGKDLEVFPLAKLRNESRFKSHEHLIDQIRRDRDRAARILSTHTSLLDQLPHTPPL
ncbi:MAG: riboflavin biosynthesis protein RibF [Candidatus Omnitrophica bacterium]|nr:riboflavin biosynthesis protein RibF [Candidatus Omnitrophota bacterium]